MQNNIGVIIVAAGGGRRMGAKIPKQYLMLKGRPVIARTIDIFVAHPRISRITCVINAEDETLYGQSIGDIKSEKLMPPVLGVGGSYRMQSVMRGLESETSEIVLIHNAVNPFVEPDDIDALIEALGTFDGAALANKIVDTLKRTDGNGRIIESIDRENTWRLQTPQAFHTDELKAAITQCALDMTDDTSIIAAAGGSVKLIETSWRNFKITTPEDLQRAEAMLSCPRVGYGYDIHAKKTGRPLYLCGMLIENEIGLDGHSDADAALHALTDAILGAIGEGDIGKLFPDTDAKNKDARSEIFLREALDRLSARGLTLTNIDMVISCDSPKISVLRERLIESLAYLTRLAPDVISIKGKTGNGMIPESLGQSISAQATVMVI